MPDVRHFIFESATEERRLLPVMRVIPNLVTKSAHFAEKSIGAPTKIASGRVDGWLALKEWLADENGAPCLRIFRSCRAIIRCLPLLLYDPKNHGDASTEPHEITHAPDALRYFASYFRMPPKGKTVPKNLFRRERAR